MLHGEPVAADDGLPAEDLRVVVDALEQGRALVANDATGCFHILDLESMALAEEVQLEVEGALWFMLPAPKVGILSIHGTPAKPQTIAWSAGAPLVG